MNCPIDNNELSKETYENAVEIDRCNLCNGAWLDKGELEKIQEVKVNDYESELSRITDHVGNAFSMANSQYKAAVNCPVCAVELERREYGYSSQILIDSCIHGHGVWLDKNELKALEVFYEKSRFEAKDIKKGFLAGLANLLKI